jgi:hypothetical protein
MSSRKQSADALIESAVSTHRQAEQLATARKREKALVSKIAEAERRADVAEALRASAKLPKPIAAKRTTLAKADQLHKRVATPVFLLSDWHVEETVDPKTVNGLNAYSLEEAERRVERLGDAITWMIEHHRASFEIREAVLWLGGDLLSGYIHEELKEVAALSPVQTVLWLQERIERLIAKVLALPGLESVTVVTSHGNHGRTTPKTQISTGAANSYEWLLYQQLRRTFEPNNRVQFYIADGEFIYLDVHGVTIRFTHGDATKFGGGVGGIMIPIRKALAKWNTHKHADISCMGHYHSLHDLPDLVVNGSLIGLSPYGMRVGSYEVPAQASFLIDAKRQTKCMATTLWPVGSEFHTRRGKR